MFSPGREPIEPFVVTAVDRPFRDHRAQELHLPFHSRNRLRKNGDDVFECLVRIVRSGHRTASQQPLHTPAWVCAEGHGPKIVGQFKKWILLANSPKQNPCGKFCSHHGARLNKNRTFALSSSTIMHSTGCICLLVVISAAVSGYHSRDGLKDLEDGAWKSRIAEKKGTGVHRWRGDAEARRAVYNNRARLRSGVAKEAFRLRAELVERSFALTLDRGGMRRA